MCESSKEPVNEAVISPTEIEKEINIFRKPNDSTPEQMDALIAELQRNVRKPPQEVPVRTEPPSESDQEDSAHVLLPRKRKRRDRRPGVLITDPVLNVSTPVDPCYVAQNIESTFTEPSSSPLPESTPMDQDFRSPIIEQEVLPTEGVQASGSSFEAPEPDTSKGKSKLSESEFVDFALLKNKVFDLEQSSVEKDLIIGNQDIRISDLEKESSIKDAKISELQANLGGLTALFFDLKQRLYQKFGDDFQPLTVKGEKIYASSSGPTNPISQSTSERIVRPAPDANLDTFLSSGPASAQERREKQIRIDQPKHSDQNAPA
ncbi:unnamed protein product [Lactuca virosa]|uniref:Uncharacterized protein n=1 Tax=Lactuca virosa TaxID=75947 RepID=A0AAU9NQB5_9ASTR|nr:unnamed protein product [Lactuca virosa]